MWIGVFSAMTIRRWRSICKNLAVVAQNMGDLAQSETLYRDVIRRQERAYGDRHPETAAAKGNYGLLLQREGRLAEAEPQLREVAR